MQPALGANRGGRPEVGPTGSSCKNLLVEEENDDTSQWGGVGPPGPGRSEVDSEKADAGPRVDRETGRQPVAGGSAAR